MSREYFTASNSEYTANQRAWLNECAANLLAEWGDADGADENNVKNACDRANDYLPASVE